MALIDELYTLEERYELLTSGEYGVFELYRNGDVIGYRGTRREHGATGVYDTYRAAIEAAMCEFGEKEWPQEDETSNQ